MPPGNKNYSYGELTPRELEKLLDSRDIFLLDVHIPEQEHIEGTDAYIPYNEFNLHRDSLPRNKRKEMVVYCLSDLMSRIAAGSLMEIGFTNVSILKGGIKSWNKYNGKKS